MIVLYIFVVLLAILALGTPIAFALGITAVGFVIFATNLPLTVLLQRVYMGVNSYTLLAVPLFMLAGSIMNKGGISRRLVDFSMALVGHIKGGLSMVAIVTSMFFGAITGTCSGASAAVGQILIPAMMDAGYPGPFAAAVTSAGSSLGVIIPPSVPMILYGSVASISVGTLFLCGVPMGISIAVVLMIACYFQVKKLEKQGLYPSVTVKFSMKRLGSTFVKAIPAFLVPVIILGGIMSGVVTPTESAALAVAAGLVIGGLVYRELSIKNIYESLVESAMGSATVLFIVATAGILGYAFTALNAGEAIMAPMLAHVDGQIGFMLVASLVLFIGGFIFDGSVMVLILIPLFIPLIEVYGVDPLQFALMTITVWCIGQQTPPVASGLYVTVKLAGCNMIQASRYNLLFIFVYFIFLMGFIFLPDVFMFLPRLVTG